MNLSLREAILTDSAMIAELSGQLGYKSTAENMQKRLSGLLNNPNHCVFVAAGDQHVVGWIHAFYSLTVESDPLVEIAGLVIDEQHRGKGIGQLLVNEIMAWAHTMAVSKIRVRSRIIRKEAHLFYQRLGFTEVKEQKVFDLPLS
jgi:GNAT superfamily N-acetyltransferase